MIDWNNTLKKCIAFWSLKIIFRLVYYKKIID